MTYPIHFLLNFVALFVYFLGIWAIHYKENVLSVQKISLPIRAMKTKMYLSENGLVLMTVPDT